MNEPTKPVRQSAVGAAVEAFNATAAELKEAADKAVYGIGSPLDVWRNGGGPVARVLRDRLEKFECPDGSYLSDPEVAAATNALLAYYGLRDYYPMVAMTREALSLASQLGAVLEKIVPHERVAEAALLLLRRAYGFSPSEVFLLGYDAVKKVAVEVEDAGR